MRLKKMIGLVVMSISTVLTLAASQGIYAQASKEEVIISNRTQLDQWIEQAQASGITITKTIENKTVAEADRLSSSQAIESLYATQIQALQQAIAKQKQYDDEYTKALSGWSRILMVEDKAGMLIKSLMT